MKLKLKEWIAKVTGFVNSSKSANTSGTISLACHRRGHIVMICSWVSFPSASDGSTITTIPVGFRPISDCDFIVFNTSGTKLGTIRIYANGQVKPVYGAMTAGTVRSTFTFIGGGCSIRVFSRLSEAVNSIVRRWRHES